MINPMIASRPFARKSEPDGASRSRVAVDLREDVAEDIGDRKQKLRAADDERPDFAELLTYQVRDQQDDHEDRQQQVEVSIGAKVARLLGLNQASS